MPDAVHPTQDRLECDLIMKGGVTSGLVYPAAIAEIARSYRLRSIGGTSAGAIAAAAAAAMEFGRQAGRNPSAPAALAAITAELGRGTLLGATFLQALFAPDRQTRPLFPFAARRPGQPAWASRWPAFAEIAALLIGAPLLAGITVGWAFGHGWLQFTRLEAALSGLLTALVLFGLCLWSAARILVQRAAARFVDNGLGLVNGMAPGGDECDRRPVPGITPWLHEKLQSLSGLNQTAVLTFGHLWRGHRHDPAASAGSTRDDQREIDLVLVATDLNRLQSVNFPFLPERSRLYIDQRRWQGLFPADVMAALRASSIGPAADRDESDDFYEKTLRYRKADVGAAAAASRDAQLHANLLLLPDAPDLPVIVAVRASLAFPGLFTPLPLLLLHWTIVDGQRVARFSPVLLSDGGITSNFPIHLFDAPVPSRPTFAINLLYPDDSINADPFTGGPREANDASQLEAIAGGGSPAPSVKDDIFMPRSNSGRVLLYKAPPTGSPLHQLIGFAGRVVEAARTWGDVSLYNQPGVRDRIVHVRLTDSEGGFNLGMTPEIISAIAAKGQFAGTVLAARFDPARPHDPLHPGEPVRLNWHNHRFVRLRAFLAAQELLGLRATAAWGRATDVTLAQSTPGLDDILRRAGRQAWPHGFPIGYAYRLTEPRRQHMAAILGHLAALAPPPPTGRGSSNSAGEGAPNPRSRLQLRPAGNDPAATRR